MQHEKHKKTSGCSFQSDYRPKNKVNFYTLYFFILFQSKKLFINNLVFKRNGILKLPRVRKSQISNMAVHVIPGGGLI